MVYQAYERPDEGSRREKPVKFNWTQQPTTAATASPLLQWSQIAPRLRSLLAEVGLTREVDVLRAIDRLSRGEVAPHLPCRRRRQWGPTVQLWMDASNRLIPYEEDFRLILQQLQLRLGSEQIELFSGLRPRGTVWRYCLSGGERTGYRVPEPGAHVLVLGDLGCLERRQGEGCDEWVWFGRLLRSRGCHPLAIVPCSTARVPPELRRLFRLHTLAPQRQNPHCSGGSAAARRLLRLISFALRVEPGLLRECRRLVPELGDPALESEIWQCGEMVNSAKAGGTLGPQEVIEPLIEEFEKLEPGELRARVLETFKRWRWRDGKRGLGCEIFFEELSRLSEATRRLLPEQDSADLEASWRWLVQQVVKQHPETREPMIDYAHRLLQREVVQSRLNPVVSESLAKLRGHFEGREMGRSAGPFRIQISQQGNEWVAQRVEEGALGRRELAGSWLATLRARTPAVFIRGGGLETEGTAGGEPWQALDIPVEAVVRLNPPAVGHVAVRTDCEGVELQRRAKSKVALAAGRDRFGLWEVTAIANRKGPPVRVRWRWIPPGTFWMGSPEDEPGRSHDEGPRHLVTLTRGYWMAETPCTQKLWQAVMGDNPSQFQSARHPVESVSWLRVQKFLRKLQRVAPYLHADLPTEAQWEYACRADSQTALYPTEKGDGTIEILVGNHVPALDPIAWYGRNSVEAEGIRRGWDSSDWDKNFEQSSTQPVGVKLPNAWGLYDMLGNVWEWCLDRWESYEAKSEVDPERCGEREGDDVSRVYRGGAWFSFARGVRCAFRGLDRAGYRGNDLGFRLVRVQETS
jgi:formylglycine-generating enzyme required for sulfatase activity